MRWKSERREGERLDGCQRGGKGRRGGGTVIQLSHREAAGGRERKVVVRVSGKWCMQDRQVQMSWKVKKKKKKNDATESISKKKKKSFAVQSNKANKMRKKKYTQGSGQYRKRKQYTLSSQKHQFNDGEIFTVKSLQCVLGNR